ncbi:MAG: ATP-binding cassette domain-containing protein [Breznakia sp.]
MLKLKNIRKSYQTGDFVQHALKDINLNFQNNEFVAVLGQSGSGKTTLLNIIGGLDRYDRGKLIINNKSTRNFKNYEWDAYRNHCVGFVFQNYNLIPHIDILANVEMALTLSGVSRLKRRDKSLDVLELVGLVEHAYKKPNQLSGGQMQRVAIARALVNDPDIILADEPTGALDSETSVQIMKLIRDIAKNKLVIMVTHNAKLAHQYANRIIELNDGEIITDTNPVAYGIKDSSSFKIVKTSMHYFSALKLSFNNIRTKKVRTLLTSFASSIGIINIALILSVSTGFQEKIDEFEKDSLFSMPVTISIQAAQIDHFSILSKKNPSLEGYSDEKIVVAEATTNEPTTHENKITQNYIDYLHGIDAKYIAGYNYTQGFAINAISENNNGDLSLIDFSTSPWNALPCAPKNKINTDPVENNYDTLAGTVDNDQPALVLTVGAKNQVPRDALIQLGFSGEEMENISFEDIMNKEVKIILNDAYYTQLGQRYVPNQNLATMYQSKGAITLKVQAILRGKKSQEKITENSTGLSYTSALNQKIISKNKNSAIVKAQKNNDFNILNGLPFDKSSQSTNKDALLRYLGDDMTPSLISIYPKDFDAKDEVLKQLDAYNTNQTENETIYYEDRASMFTALSANIMSAVSVVLVAFSIISLTVSSMMIGIIAYTSVLERTKEIGILRSLGARKKDITRVFNAETLLIGSFSGIFGIGLSVPLCIPLSNLITNLSGLDIVAKLHPSDAIILIVVNLTLTFIGGLLPAKMAAKKDPVDALRSE